MLTDFEKRDLGAISSGLTPLALIYFARDVKNFQEGFGYPSMNNGSSMLVKLCSTGFTEKMKTGC